MKKAKKSVKKNVKKEKTFKPKKYSSYGKRIAKRVFWIVLFFAISIGLLISIIKVRTKSNIVYNQNSNVDYKVYLKPNDYYKEPYLGKNMKYIASLIDNITADFTYNFSANQDINYRYTYYIKADVAVAADEEGNVIYSKSDTLTEPKTVSGVNSSNFDINETLKINYNEYNDLVKGFKSSYGISASSNLTLSFMLTVTDERGNIIGELNNKDVMKLTIPLTEQMINIKLDYKELHNSNTASIYRDFYISNNVMLGLSILSFIISFILLVKLIVFVSKTTGKKSAYSVTLGKILREYDRVIVNSKNVVDLNDEVIDVNSFNELLDVRDNLEKPIIFCEVHKGQKAMFVVKTPNETYRYILKAVDLENTKKID